ncbi:ABC transporter substrate-binding protein [Nonomuraea purpurea]|uniref:ABC transporter substrate-binding protein n=1 Tax=Nonomuraea purpurea TaxID=1849276 RepID=A0ABV8GQK8_9ACTN
MGDESDPRSGFAERLRALKDAVGVSVRDLEVASARTPRRRDGLPPLRLKRSTIAGMISRTRPVRPEQENFEVFVDTCLRIGEESGRSLPDDLADPKVWDAAYRDLLLDMAGMRSTSRMAGEAAKRLRSSDSPSEGTGPSAEPVPESAPLPEEPPGEPPSGEPSPSPPGPSLQPPEFRPPESTDSPQRPSGGSTTLPPAVGPFRRWMGRRAMRAAALTLTGVVIAAWAVWPAAKDMTGAPDASTTVASVGGDGVLRLGVLVPWSGDLQFFNRPMAAGVRLAVNEINAAGGVFGRDVSEVETDSGDSTTDLHLQALNMLITGGSDVVIGPITSSMSLELIDQAKSAGVAQISPTATADQLSDADDDGLFFRMVAPDSIQGDVLAKLIAADGGRRVGVLALDDPYGTGLSERIRRSLENRGITDLHAETYDTFDTSYTTEVKNIKDSAPDTIVVVGRTETAAVARELVRQGLGVDRHKWYFVDGNLSFYGRGLPRGTLTGVKATMAGAEVTDAFRRRLASFDPGVTDFKYAPEAYDATIVAALAALAAGRDDPKSIARAMADVTRGGERCTDFRTCARLLASGEDIDYDGASGPIDFTDRGDPATAPIGIYQYKATNTYISLSHELGELPT